MPNTWVNASTGDLARYTLDSFLNSLKFIKTIDTQYDAEFKKRGSKNSGVLLIKEPNEFSVRSGATMQVQDIRERTQTFVLATQRGIDIDTSTVELSLSIEKFQEDVLNPMMDRLAADVEFACLSQAYRDLHNHVGTPGNEIATTLAVIRANERITDELAPDGDRYLLLNPANMSRAVSSVGALFHKASEVERAFSKAYIGEAFNFKWMESTMVPNHIAGTRTGTALCNTATGIVNESPNIALTGLTNGHTFTVGDIITIADVFAINRQTKQRYMHLQPFVVTTAHTVSGTTGTLVVSPTPFISGPRQNVELVAPGASKTVNLTVNGAANSVFVQPMAYHKKAFAIAFADMFMSPKEDMAVKVHNGVSIRVWRDGTIINDTFPLRIDVLFGFRTVRPQWATRVFGA